MSESRARRKENIDDDFAYFPWFEGKYRKATAWFTSPLQHTIYRALCAYYCQEGPLLNEDEDLRAICMMGAAEWDEAWAKYWPKIKARFFTEDGARLRNAFADKVLAWQRKITGQKSKAGKAGAEARWGNGDRDPPEKSEERLKAVQSPVIAEAIGAYNGMAATHSWPACEKLTDARRKKLTARLNDCGGLEGWIIALEKAAASDFLCGRIQRDDKHVNWKLDIDFLLQDSSFTKLMEGKYDNRKPSPNGPGTSIGKGSSPPVEDRRAAIVRGARSGFVAAGRAPAKDTGP